jgi:hypothetical protein
MYTHASASKISVMEWIRIHMPSEDQYMTASFLVVISSRHVVLHHAKTCELDHDKQNVWSESIITGPNADSDNAFCASCGGRPYQRYDAT